jgi:PBSX family phage terminase large subunit
MVRGRQDALRRLTDLLTPSAKSEADARSRPENHMAPNFIPLYMDVLRGDHTEYWLGGGRGSTKSSAVSLIVVDGVMRHKDANAVALRKVGKDLRESVYSQLLWAIDTLGVTDQWIAHVSPMELIYKPTGGKIVFRGVDNPRRTKSIKFRRGYCRYVWYEEVDEFHALRELRAINQTFKRGGKEVIALHTYNPPRSARNWVNAEVLVDKPGRMVHHSTYLTVPPEWLGEQALIEAEHLKETNPEAYRHEYLGEVTGTGAEVFTNITARAITDKEIAAFDNIRRGLDFGYTTDPLAYVAVHYDRTRRRLYIYDEIYKVRLSNRAAAERIKSRNKLNQPVTADSAEPKSIAEMCDLGLRVRAARKGPDSVEYGIKWLQDLEEIVIDKTRCPNAYREFVGYELEPDKNGGYKARFPDGDNHTIDATRYALEDDMRRRGGRFVQVRG